MCFRTKKVKAQQQNKKSNIKPLPEPGFEPGTSCTKSVTFAPTSQLRVTSVVKRFNCFNAMGRNINKVKFAGHIFSTPF